MATTSTHAASEICGVSFFTGAYKETNGKIGLRHYEWEVTEDELWLSPKIWTTAFITNGHGYLSVHRSAIEYFGVEHLISEYSYETSDGEFVLLEEDCDWQVFCSAVRNTPSYGEAPNYWSIDWSEVFIDDLEDLQGHPGWELVPFEMSITAEDEAKKELPQNKYRGRKSLEQVKRDIDYQRKEQANGHH